MKKTKIVGIMLLVSMLSFEILGEDQTFEMKTYTARLEESKGNILIHHGEVKILELPLLTFVDQQGGKRSKIWIIPEKVKVSKDGENTEIKISFKKPGSIKKFDKEIILMPDSISIDVKALPSKTLLCQSVIQLSPEVFTGSEYSGIKGKKTISGKMPVEIPAKPKYVINELKRLSKITFAKTKIGSVVFEFTQKSPRGIGDSRSMKSKPYYSCHYVKNCKADKECRYSATIKITGKE